MSRRLAAMSFLGVTLAVAPACGGGSSKPAVVIDVKGAEFSYTPSTITLTTKGGTVRLTNAGTTPHDLIIPQLGLGTREIPAGSSIDLPLDSLKVGSYRFLCDITGHAQAGMVGTLTVTRG